MGICYFRKLFCINSKDLIYWGTPLTFDPSMIELLLALQSGACLLIVPYRVSLNVNALFKALFNITRVTVLQMVPSVFLRWKESQIRMILNELNLKILAFGGEVFPRSILDFHRKKGLRIFNLYGITEVSCWATVHEIVGECSEDNIPLGENLGDTSVELRNKDGKVIDYGRGEIFIGSTSRVCYINEEIYKENKGLVFRASGDVADKTENGLFYVGRKNKIIKRYGHKINLTGMEHKVFQETGLESKCIWSRQHSKILMFILLKDINMNVKEKTLDKLRVKLLNTLPEESFPDFIEVVQNFPLTSHGKINEKYLEDLYFVNTPTTMNYIETFSELWCKYLGISSDTIDEMKESCFLEMGGNSVLALQLINEFKETINSDYPKELYSFIFEKSFEECLNYLKSFKPARKRNNHEIVTDTTTSKNNSKKAKTTRDELNILWTYDLKACIDSSPKVFVRRGTVYISVGSFSHILSVLSETGQEIFKEVLPDSVESTPIISSCGDFLLVGCFDGKMYCIDFLGRNYMWEFKTNGRIKSSPCICKNQSAIVFGSYDRSVYCVSIKDGTELWKTTLDGSIASNPLQDELSQTIFISTTSGTCFCLDEASGEVKWKYACGSPIFGSACLIDLHKKIVLAAVDGTLYCFSKIGEIVWKYKAQGHIFSSVVCWKDFLAFGCFDKNIYVLKIFPLSCELVSKISLDSEISSTPFIYTSSNVEIIVTACNSGVIYVIDFKTYEILYSVQLPNEVFSSPVVYGNRIYVGCRDNNLYSIELKNKE